MTESEYTPSALAAELLDLLVCPVTRGPLHYDSKASELISPQAGLAYPVRDGIPILLASEARTLDEDVSSVHSGL